MSQSTKLVDTNKKQLVMVSCLACDSCVVGIGYDSEPYIYHLCMRFNISVPRDKVCRLFESSLRVTCEKNDANE